MASVNSKAFSDIRLYTLRNNSGLEASFSSYGATLTRLLTPDRQGRFADIVLGHASLEAMLNATYRPYFGATVGRYANRIAKGRFKLNGRKHLLAVNNGANHLHGGDAGFDKIAWKARELRSSSRVLVCCIFVQRKFIYKKLFRKLPILKLPEIYSKIIPNC